MLFKFFLPLVFVALWSSAFVTAKVGVQYATPFAMLLLRFILVSLLFGGVLAATRLWKQRTSKTMSKGATALRPDTNTIALTALVGILLHGVYLGSVFFALSVGLSAGISALIVSLQPLLASALAVSLFGEKLHRLQIAGLMSGIMGVALVLLPKLDGGMPPLGLISVTIGLATITGGTLLQKQIGGRIDLLHSNVVQSMAAASFFALICLTIETPEVNWQPAFIMALAWQVLMVSAGAYVILMVLIRRDTMASVSALLFLVPPVTAIIAAVGFDEPLTIVSLAGFAITSVGVYLVTGYRAKPV